MDILRRKTPKSVIDVWHSTRIQHLLVTSVQELIGPDWKVKVPPPFAERSDPNRGRKRPSFTRVPGACTPGIF